MLLSPDRSLLKVTSLISKTSLLVLQEGFAWRLVRPILKVLTVDAAFDWALTSIQTLQCLS